MVQAVLGKDVVAFALPRREAVDVDMVFRQTVGQDVLELEFELIRLHRRMTKGALRAVTSPAPHAVRAADG